MTNHVATFKGLRASTPFSSQFEASAHGPFPGILDKLGHEIIRPPISGTEWHVDKASMTTPLNRDFSLRRPEHVHCLARIWKENHTSDKNERDVVL
jgi:hypothetical protein